MTSASSAETRILVVYPKPEQPIFEDSTFLMGGVSGLPAGARLWVNGQAVPVSHQGFFAWKIPIHAGLNPVRLEVRMAESVPPEAEELFALYGVPPLDVLPALPLAVHEETLAPASDVWLTPADTLTVACSASMDAEVSFTIPGWLETPVWLQPVQNGQAFLDTREMIFAELHWNAQRIPTQGAYQVSIPVKSLLEKAKASAAGEGLPADLPMVLQLRHGEQVLEQRLPGRLTILTAPRMATVTQDQAVTRTSPENGARLTPQRTQTRVAIDGLEKNWARARLSQEEAFYLPLDVLAFDAGQAAQPESIVPMRLASIKTETQDVAAAATVRLIFSAHPEFACPVQVEAVPSKRMNRLQVRFYGVCSHCDFIQYPPENTIIQQLHWRQVSENVLELWIDLHRPLAGYDYAWQSGEWRLAVKSLPANLADIRVLIDPGHGGAETGSTGLNGLPEKELNLTVSRLLRDALLQEGFQVSLTRNGDQALSLPERGQLVVDKKADIVLSLHHNALPDGRDPLRAEGASCFYYHAFSKPLAQALLDGLTDNRGNRFTVPNYGLFYDSLYMIRIHQALAVLVEIGFFTNPQEFERLIDPAFQQEEARRLASVLRQYCQG